MKYRLLYLVGIFFFIVTCLNAQEIININLKKTNNKIYLSAELDEDIPKEVFELLHNGVKVTIVYYIKVYKETPFYFFSDSKIKDIEYKKVVKYNMWEKVYNLKENEKKVKISSKKEINQKLKQLINIFLIKGGKLSKKDKCYVKVKASLESVKLFPPLSWIFDLVFMRGFETSWEIKNIE